VTSTGQTSGKHFEEEKDLEAQTLVVGDIRTEPHGEQSSVDAFALLKHMGVDMSLVGGRDLLVTLH
jgi:hypothetical protein